MFDVCYRALHMMSQSAKHPLFIVQSVWQEDGVILRNVGPWKYQNKYGYCTITMVAR